MVIPTVNFDCFLKFPFAAGFALLIPALALGQNSSIEFDPVTVIPATFSAIKNVVTFAADSEKVTLDDDELVLGVEVNGYARAYPINMLKGPYREIINDKLGGKAIAATW